MKADSKTYIVIVNYKGWRDTLECLESVFRMDGSFTVIVCDNGSGDPSLDHIHAWARGDLDVWVPPANRLRKYSHPPIRKPVPTVELLDDELARDVPGDARLILIRSRQNLGFAGGCNLGMTVALRRDDCRLIWLLNNDTVVRRDSLLTMIDRIERDAQAGICGSSLLFYHSPERMQLAGGAILNRWLGTVTLCHAGGHLQDVDPAGVESTMSFVAGASMLVTRQFVETVGLMDPSYFLYYEEIDWTLRAGRRFRSVYAKDSIVYHKEGGSIGTSSDPTKRSLLADQYSVRNRIRFTRRFYPYALPTVYLALLAAIFNRLRRGQASRVPMILRAMFGL
jgi:GT2 family glycosyltransferase